MHVVESGQEVMSQRALIDTNACNKMTNTAMQLPWLSSIAANVGFLRNPSQARAFGRVGAPLPLERQWGEGEVQRSAGRLCRPVAGSIREV